MQKVVYEHKQNKEYHLYVRGQHSTTGEVFVTISCPSSHVSSGEGCIKHKYKIPRKIATFMGKLTQSNVCGIFFYEIFCFEIVNRFIWVSIFPLPQVVGYWILVSSGWRLYWTQALDS